MSKAKSLTLEQAYGNLSADERTTELASGFTVDKVYLLIKNDDREEISRFVRLRFYRRYVMPFEKVSPEFNSGFAQMAACCLMIEAMESFRHGWNDTRDDAKKADGKTRIKGGEIFEGFFAQYDNLKEFRGWGGEFYSSIRCGILHQAETTNGWIVMREGPLFDEPSRTINSTIFRRRLKKCLKQYCEELKTASDTSDVWDCFKTKMTNVMQNCKMGVKKS